MAYLFKEASENSEIREIISKFPIPRKTVFLRLYSLCTFLA